MLLEKENKLSAVIYRYRYLFFFLMILLITIINLHLDIMEVDAAQYASISLEMSQRGNYLQVYHRGSDYLDKPPLLFWLSSLSISLFGNHQYAYKLPAVILLLITLWITYQFGKLWYDKKTGLVAALILGTTSGYYLMTNDVRTDGVLMAFVMLAVYFISFYLKNADKVFLLLGGVCIGCAMLAKGPLGLIIPAIAIGCHLLMNRDWKKIFNPDWIWVILIIAIVLSPMLYGLYTQFDQHPEKEVYGLQGPSGIKFFFWTQSFGRITGENYWQNDTTPLFFLGSILWDMQPWVILFFIALAWKIRKLFRNRKNKLFKDHQSESSAGEWITFFGFVIPLIALSLSRYKLPHYIFPLFPFAAMITASFLVRQVNQLPRWFTWVHYGILHAFVVMIGLVLFWIFPGDHLSIIICCIILYAVFWLFLIMAKDKTDQWVLPTLTIAVIFQFVFSTVFYPHLLKYQSTSQAGWLMHHENPDDVFFYKRHGHALDFYSGRILKEWKQEKINELKGEAWIFTDEEGKNELNNYEVIREFDDYPVTLLNRQFLNPETRDSKLKKTYLLKVEND